MSESDASITGTINRIQEDSAPGIDSIPFVLISRHDRKTTNLLNNSPNQSPLKSKNQWYKFEFTELMFITTIVIKSDDFRNGHEIEFKWIGADALEFYGASRISEGQAKCNIFGLCSLVAIKPERTFLSSPSIREVEINGFPLKQAGDFLDFVQNLDSLKDDALKTISTEFSKLKTFETEVQALQANRGSLQQDIQNAKTALSRENTKLRQSKENLEQLRADITNAKSEYIQYSTSTLNEKSKLEKLNNEISDFEKNIAQKTAQLKKLESDLSLFPSEISGFTQQASIDSTIFQILALIPILLMVVIFVLVASGAADLTTKIDYGRDVNIPALIASRAPYVAIMSVILALSYYIARMAINEIIHISRQRLSLTKISIVAKDISNSIDRDISLTDAEIYNNRLLLKMDLMKDYMKDYISSDFKPTLPSSLPSITRALKGD